MSSARIQVLSFRHSITIFYARTTRAFLFESKLILTATSHPTLHIPSYFKLPTSYFLYISLTQAGIVLAQIF